MLSPIKIFATGKSITIAEIVSFRDEIMANISSGMSIRIDASALNRCDLTFVQCMISASRSFAAKGLDFSIVGSRDVIDAAFARCGVEGLKNRQSEL